MLDYNCNSSEIGEGIAFVFTINLSCSLVVYIGHYLQVFQGAKQHGTASGASKTGLPPSVDGVRLPCDSCQE